MGIINRMATESYVSDSVSNVKHPVTSVNGQTGDINIPTLPDYSQDNNNQFLQIIDGIPAWTTIGNAEEVEF